MITIYTISYNEELMMPFFIRHYRKMFPGCRIVIYDNQSDDKTFEIAMSFGNVIFLPYDTGGKLSDETYLKIKNNCWRGAETDWVLIADVDEHLQINQWSLEKESTNGVSIIRAHGFNMVNLADDLNIEGITHGVVAPSYDKFYLFNKAKIRDINYGAGAHRASPVGQIKFSEPYHCFHYKYVNIDYMVKRHAHFASRLSDDNKKRGYGVHYQFGEERIKNEFKEARKNAIKLI